jgi:hypothetical protein
MSGLGKPDPAPAPIETEYQRLAPQPVLVAFVSRGRTNALGAGEPSTHRHANPSTDESWIEELGADVQFECRVPDVATVFGPGAV